MSHAWLPTLDCGVALGQVEEVLRRDGLVRIAGFPANTAHLIGFVSGLGTPLGYYGGDAGTHADNGAIWQVKYDPEASSRGEVHAVDGPLPVHSSQALREPRPRYFCMLMVDPGWQDAQPGYNGESLLVRWSDALQEISQRKPATYQSILETLLRSIRHPDDSLRSIAYRLADMRNDFDFGVRLKSDLLAHLRDSAPEDPVTSVVTQFADAAQRMARRVQLEAGDLVLVDNDRWGHGRESTVGRRRTATGDWLANPRELWSLTIA